MDKFHLPEDILEELILPRLPPKSLVRFMCVSKSWYNLIKSTSFVTKQLSWSKRHKNPSILFRRQILGMSTRTRCDLVSLVVDDELVSNVSLPLGDMWTTSFYHHLQIAGHCDGIVCLRLCFGNLVLCNPTIKDFKLVPKSRLLLPEEESVTCIHIARSIEILGFGYDPKGKDYKVIRGMRFANGTGHSNQMKAEVYTMGTNSWRQINWTYKDGPDGYDRKHVPLLDLTDNTQQLFFNGIYYWQTYFSMSCILSFDMGDELFNEIPFPLFESESNDDVRYCELTSSCLSVWKDETSIALVTPWLEKSCEHYVNYDLWLLNSCAWTKHLTITTKQLYGIIQVYVPLVFLGKSDQLLAAKNFESVVVSYDLVGKEQGMDNVFQSSSGYSYLQAVEYVNSLVPVTGGHKLEGLHKSDLYASEQLSRGYESKNDMDKRIIRRYTMVLEN